MWNVDCCNLPAVAKALHKQLARFLRERRGELSYAQFARKLGVSPSTLHRMEQGEQNVTLETLEQIMNRLKCRWDEIFDGGE